VTVGVKAEGGRELLGVERRERDAGEFAQ